MAVPEESTISLISERDNFARYASLPPLYRTTPPSSFRAHYASFVTFNPFPSEKGRLSQGASRGSSATIFAKVPGGMRDTSGSKRNAKRFQLKILKKAISRRSLFQQKVPSHALSLMNEKYSRHVRLGMSDVPEIKKQRGIKCTFGVVARFNIAAFRDCYKSE